MLLTHVLLKKGTGIRETIICSLVNYYFKEKASYNKNIVLTLAEGMLNTEHPINNKTFEAMQILFCLRSKNNICQYTCFFRYFHYRLFHYTSRKKAKKCFQASLQPLNKYSLTSCVQQWYYFRHDVHPVHLTANAYSAL